MLLPYFKGLGHSVSHVRAGHVLVSDLGMLSADCRGSAFWACLVQEDSPQGGVPIMSSPQYHILWIDDDLDPCEVLKPSRPEIRFTFAHTFTSGLESIRDGAFDLFVLDSWLPDGSG